MSIQSQAQDMSNVPFIVVDPSEGHPQILNMVNSDEFITSPEEEDVEVHDEHEPLEVIIKFDGVLPGAPDSPEPIEVVEEPVEVEDKSKDENDVKSKKNEKWDWASKGPTGFIDWIKQRFNSVPKHSGMDTAGIGRACAYLERLLSEIHKAMRMDLDGELDANIIEDICSKIEDGIDKLNDRDSKISKSKKSRKKKSEEEINELVKTAQKITGVKGIYVTVPLLISGIARVCINGNISAGHDITQIYQDQVKKFKLNDREKTEVRWLLFDMGYPIRGDRGFTEDEPIDTTSCNNYDYSANYNG
jgi:hypothetical protein